MLYLGFIRADGWTSSWEQAVGGGGAGGGGFYITLKSVFPRKERKIEEGDRSARGFASYAISIERQIYVYKPAADQPRD